MQTTSGQNNCNEFIHRSAAHDDIGMCDIGEDAYTLRSFFSIRPKPFRPNIGKEPRTGQRDFRPFYTVISPWFDRCLSQPCYICAFLTQNTDSMCYGDSIVL
jgi:hypothetical protein